MPIFARRRLQAMFIDLASYMDGNKGADLLKRLEHRDTNTALAAEAELSMLWAISRVAHLRVEPSAGARRPDALSMNLFASAGAVIEVRALSDYNFSGQEAMCRTANIICNYASQLRKGAGDDLYFEFGQTSYYSNHRGFSRFHRVRLVDPNFQLSPAIRKALHEWIVARTKHTPSSLTITEGKTSVKISRRVQGSHLDRVFCSMPPLAYDLEDNPIYKALRKKSRQVKDAPAGSLRCVFLVDAGCQILRRLAPISALHEIGGQQIIHHALAKLNIDVVCVFSPHRRGSVGLGAGSQIVWRVTAFDKRTSLPEDEHAHLNQLAMCLPHPRYEGYQARELHMQRVFDPQARGDYVAPSITTHTNEERMTIKISSRLLHEYLAGRICTDQFVHFSGNLSQYFEAELKRGHTIQSVRLESGGLDEDDDHLVFELESDYAAGPLQGIPAPSSKSFLLRMMERTKVRGLVTHLRNRIRAMFR